MKSAFVDGHRANKGDYEGMPRMLGTESSRLAAEYGVRCDAGPSHHCAFQRQATLNVKILFGRRHGNDAVCLIDQTNLVAHRIVAADGILAGTPAGSQMS